MRMCIVPCRDPQKGLQRVNYERRRDSFVGLSSFLVFSGFKLCSVWLQGHEGDLGEGDHSQGHGQSHR